MPKTFGQPDHRLEEGRGLLCQPVGCTSLPTTPPLPQQQLTCLKNFFLIKLFYINYLFLAVPSLHCCAWASSSWGEQGLLLIEGTGLQWLHCVGSVVVARQL